MSPGGSYCRSFPIIIIFMHPILVRLYVFSYVDGLHKEPKQTKGWEIACYWTFHGRYLAVCNALTRWYNVFSSITTSVLPSLNYGRKWLPKLVK